MAGKQQRTQHLEAPTDDAEALELTRIVHELHPPGPDVAKLCRLLAEARTLFGAHDVSLSVHDPRSPIASPTHPWFADTTPANLESALRDPTEGHLPLRRMRHEGLTVAAIGGLSPRTHRGPGSAYLRALEVSGRSKVLLGHIGGHESLGRVEWYRSDQDPDFSDEDEIRLRMLLPSLADVLRGQVGTTDDENSETALINAAGQILWATPGFRFRWNAVTPVAIPSGHVPLNRLLDDPNFGRRIALQILGLADPLAPVRHEKMQVDPNERPARVTAEWTVLPGGPYGCVGRVMELELVHAPTVVPLKV